MATFCVRLWLIVVRRQRLHRPQTTAWQAAINQLQLLKPTKVLFVSRFNHSPLYNILLL